MATASIPAGFLQRPDGSLWSRMPSRKPVVVQRAAAAVPASHNSGWAQDAAQEKHLTQIGPDTGMSPEEPKLGLSPERGSRDG